jgi:hypothetical protein
MASDQGKTSLLWVTAGNLSGRHEPTVAVRRDGRDPLHDGVPCVRAHRLAIEFGGTPMRFRNAAGHVDLPIYAVEHRFRNEPVLTVLPVRGAVGGRDALLVALPSELAVIIADPERQDGWMTYLAPWEVVRLGQLVSEAGIHHLEVHIDSLVLLAELWGPTGEHALRDFIVAAGVKPEGLVTAT